MEKLYLTLIEVDNAECPNIGTISGNSEEELKEKAIEAIESHFDTGVGTITIQDGLGFMDVRNSPPLDAVVNLDNSHGFESEPIKIEIQQTFLY